MLYRRGPRPRRLVLRIVAASGAATVLGITACFPGQVVGSEADAGGESGFSGSSGSGSSSGFSGSSGSSSGGLVAGLVDATSWYDAASDSSGWVDGAQVESSTETGVASDAAVTDAPIVTSDAGDEGE